MSFGYGGGRGSGRRWIREPWEYSGWMSDRGGISRGQSLGMDESRRGRHPPHLRGKEIGDFYARQAAARKRQADRSSVGTQQCDGMIINL